MTQPLPDSPALEILPAPSLGSVVSINLAVPIKIAFAAAHQSAQSATDHARNAITNAVDCGQLLARQKASLPHGAWLEWLAQHCPEIAAETARRYMRLAKRSQETDLTDAVSLRQAYLATGVLPQPAARGDETPSVDAPIITFTRGLDLFRRWYHRRTDELPLEKWTPRARQILRNELTWFKKLHDQLAEKTDSKAA